MPARQYTSDQVVPVLQHTIDAVGEAIDGLTAEQLSATSVLSGWSVRDLTAHLVVVADSVCHIEPLPANAGVLSVSEYLAGYADRAERIDSLTREAEGELTDIPAAYRERWDDALARLAAFADVDKVLARRGAARLADLVITRVIELVVHADDLARSLPQLQLTAPPPDAERLVTRALLDVLATRHPGQTLEVRIPPVAVVQCLPGPRHTRGTPPGVVETDPRTWVRLAAGRLGWAQAVEEGLVAASGQRADLSGVLPLL